MMRVVVECGEVGRPGGPLSVGLADEAKVEQVGLVDAASGRPVACQLDQEGVLHFWAEPMRPGEVREYLLRRDEGQAGRPAVQIDRSRPDQAAVRIDGQLFTVYCFGAELARPILYPLIGPQGEAVTRHWPMRTDVAGESTDHVHHRSCWVAWGDVDGVDHWSEQAGHGMQRHVGFARWVEGAVFGELEAVIEWCRADGRRQLSERRRMRFYASAADVRVFDLDVRFEMTDGDVRFGDTKEGGLCSVRVASSMEGQRGGQIRNAVGGVGEKQCWGKPAAWCDYVGRVAGETVGIAILDWPGNFRHPVTWHVRDYGLMTANPFGLSYFTGDKSVDGSHTWRAGESVRFFYRVVVHKGGTDQADVGGQWLNFSQPATVRLV